MCTIEHARIECISIAFVYPFFLILYNFSRLLKSSTSALSIRLHITKHELYYALCDLLIRIMTRVVVTVVLHTISIADRNALYFSWHKKVR